MNRDTSYALSELAKGANLTKLNWLCRNQKTVSTSKLEALLDDVYELQKSYVRPILSELEKQLTEKGEVKEAAFDSEGEVS